MTDVVRVTGTSDPEEIAAVLAALTTRPRAPEIGSYERWRRTRTSALRATRKR
jgi:hypothetical protein